MNHERARTDPLYSDGQQDASALPAQLQDVTPWSHLREHPDPEIAAAGAMKDSLFGWCVDHVLRTQTDWLNALPQASQLRLAVSPSYLYLYVVMPDQTCSPVPGIGLHSQCLAELIFW
jgi:hypothetical protein